MVWATSKWWEEHLPNLDLMQAGDALCWYLMWDYDPPPYAQISVCLYVLLFPYIDDVIVLFMGMYGGRMGSICVPHGMETLYVPCDTCFRESIGSTMFVSYDFLTPCGMDFAHIILTLEEQFMGGWIGEHLAYDESLIFDDVTNGGEVLQISPYQLLEDKQHFGGEDCNIPT